MATKQAAKTTAVAKWDEELARQAKLASAMEESTATGNFFSLKGGILAFNDAPVPNNEMAVVVLDGVLENVYYEGKYDPDNIQGPKCFAFGRDEKTMEPHKIVVEAGNSMAGASGLCQGCEMNEWGSADTGRGKACRNTRRLAMVAAGTFEAGRFKAFNDEEQLEKAGIAYMKLPVTSVKGYAAFVKQIANALNRPPHAIYTKVSVRPDPQTQFKVVFEPLSTIPNELLGMVMKRHEEAKASIEFPYTPFEEAPAPQRGGRAAPLRGKAAPAAKKRY
jgi:hypothetical protein